MRNKGRAWFENVLLPRFAPVSMTALLATLVLIFGVSRGQHHEAWCWSC
jgi:ACR3 family arsenite transporter